MSGGGTSGEGAPDEGAPGGSVSGNGDSGDSVGGERLRCEVAIVGSGFAGAILARVLASSTRADGRPRRVVLLERGVHPRFALGESSTPLAAIALERLAARHGLPDLRALAAYGRWSERYPALRRGLKRGFSFFAHQAGRPYANAAANEARLLVAASPNEALADAHWLREDVDAELVRQARDAGVVYRDRVLLDGLEEGEDRIVLRGERQGEQGSAPIRVEADFLVDASGRDGFLATCLPIASAVSRVPVATALLAGHFGGARPFAEAARADGAELAPGPYPDDRAAVHHLLDVGWMYQLPFDHGVLSAGFLLRHECPEEVLLPAEPLDAMWRRLCARYPTLARQMAPAEPVRPLVYRARAQHRLARAVPEGGRGRWLLLPSAFTFTDPLFSTGIAWSLVAVERVAAMFTGGTGPAGAAPIPDAPAPEVLARYGALLAREADWIDRLIAGAYRAMAAERGSGRLRLFATYAQLYFAVASFAEASQRLLPAERDRAWEGFLGCDDPVARTALAGAIERLTDLGQAPSTEDEARFERWITAAIEPRNIAGLANPARHNLYPVDFDPLITGAAKLGLTPEEVRAALPALLTG